MFWASKLPFKVVSHQRIIEKNTENIYLYRDITSMFMYRELAVVLLVQIIFTKRRAHVLSIVLSVEVYIYLYVIS